MKRFLMRHWEFVLYALCGVGTVAVDLGLYVLLVDRLGIRAANAWGWCGSVIFAFLSNKYVVFHRLHEGARAFWRELGEFLAVRAVSLLIEVQGVEFLVRRGLDQPVLGVTGGLAKTAATVVVIVINYVMSKFFIFRTRSAETG